jgi:hypothetical protein
MSVTAVEPSEPIDPIDPIFFDWMNEVVDLAVGADGTVFAVAPAGVALLYGSGESTLIDVEGLPEGTPGDGWPGRYITHVAVPNPQERGTDGMLWVAGNAVSHTDDEQFGRRERFRWCPIRADT